MLCSSDLKNHKICVLSFCAKVGEPTIVKGSHVPSHLSCLFSESRSSTLLDTARQLLFQLFSTNPSCSFFFFCVCVCPLHTLTPFTQFPVTCSCYVVETVMAPDWHILECCCSTSKRLDGTSHRHRQSARGYFPCIYASQNCMSATERGRHMVPVSARAVAGILQCEIICC